MQDVETARLLLKAGANADLSNRYGVKPLHLAISERRCRDRSAAAGGEGRSQLVGSRPARPA